jgi:NTP pyrophosphatase (non-canonical NTP hydrolase)
MNLDRLSIRLHETAVEKGFWDALGTLPEEDKFIFYAKQIAMIHSEATEVLEALRKSKGHDQVVEELADIIIRVCDLYEGLRENGEVLYSLNKVVRDKARINKGRPKLHGVRG